MSGDATYGTGFSNTGQSGIRIVNGTGTVIDSVGTTASPCREGTGLSFSTTSPNFAYARNVGPTPDSDNNASDFAGPQASDPQNRASDTAPSVLSTTPMDGAVATANVTVTFSEPVTALSTAFTIACTTSGPHPFALGGGPTTFILDPVMNFVNNETCTVTITAAQVSDLDTIDPPDFMAADYSFAFGVGTRIRTIQGAAHTSPLAGASVADVPGIVTAVASNGFYFQDPTPDANPATSEGIFVFTSSAPTVTVGNSVVVGGTVNEFRPGGATSTNLTTTQITSTAINVVSAIAPLPDATIIGAAGRIPPRTVIEDDAAGDVETSGTFDPASDGIDFYESLEGMVVRVDNAVATGPTNDFGEISVLPDGGATFGTRTTRGGIVVQPGDFNPERIILDDVLVPTPIVNTGDRFGTVGGILDYGFGNFKLLVTATPTVTPGGIAREVTSVMTAPNSLTVATFNVENLDPGDDPAKFAALAGIIVGNLGTPDILALEEIQDNNGPTNDSVVDASQTFQQLISAIATAGGPTYEFRQINPTDDQDGGEPGGNIRVGFLFRTDRGVSFVDRPGGTATSAVGVTGTGAGTQLTFSPGRIDPTNSAFGSSRKPLAGEFSFNGRTFFVIANHFNSKGGDQPLFGRYQPPTLSSEAQRRQQAQIVHDFVQQLVTADPNANVVVLGDLNDFQFSAPLGILKGTTSQILYTLIDTLPVAEQYTYVFDGNSQALDHMLVSRNLFTSASVAYDVVHANAEFADQISDHDPQIARFTLSPSTPIAGNLSVTTLEDTAITVVLDGTVANGGTLQYSIVTPPAHGTLGPIDGNRVTYTPAGDYSGPDSFTYKATEGGVESNTATVTLAVGAVNDPPVAANGAASPAAETPVEVVLAATDVDSPALTFSIVTSPAHGSLGALNGNRVVYTPAAGYSGPDTFTFRANDGAANSNVAVISITVNSPSSPPSYTLTVSTTGSGSVTPGTGTYPAGQAATLAAMPTSGNVFIGWTVDGAFAGFANPLTITMGANHSAVAAFAVAPTFRDVSSGTPYNEAITRLAARGIIRGFGDGTFGPEQAVKRAESAALIARAMGWDAEDHGNVFTDRCEPLDSANCIDADLWRNVGTLAFYDVARGFPSSEYRPRDEVAHVQVISFITRAMVAKGYWVQATADDPTVYPNVPMDSGHRLDLVTFVRYAGAIPDRPTNQNWADWDTAASRGWYAQVLDQALRSRFATTP